MTASQLGALKFYTLKVRYNPMISLQSAEHGLIFRVFQGTSAIVSEEQQTRATGGCFPRRACLVSSAPEKRENLFCRLRIVA